MLALQEHAAHYYDPACEDIQRAGRTVTASRSSSPSQERDSEPLLTLAGDALGTRYRCWRGASGRRYVFSAYSRQACPAYSHVVMLVAAVQRDGARNVHFVVDTGSFPDIALAKASTEWAKAGREIEFHVHLLATSLAERRAVIADLSQARRS
jgi:hypothetical protein